jgi:hypothetical protein
MTTYDKVRYPLKTSYHDGTTVDRRSHVLFEPLDFIARLAALVPKPRVNLTGFHGVFVRGGLHQTVGTEQQSLRKTVYLFLFVRFLINTEKAI